MRQSRRGLPPYALPRALPGEAARLFCITPKPVELDHGYRCNDRRRASRGPSLLAHPIPTAGIEWSVKADSKYLVRSGDLLKLDTREAPPDTGARLVVPLAAAAISA